MKVVDFVLVGLLTLLAFFWLMLFVLSMPLVIGLFFLLDITMVILVVIELRGLK